MLYLKKVWKNFSVKEVYRVRSVRISAEQATVTSGENEESSFRKAFLKRFARFHRSAGVSGRPLFGFWNSDRQISPFSRTQAGPQNRPKLRERPIEKNEENTGGCSRCILRWPGALETAYGLVLYVQLSGEKCWTNGQPETVQR